jgi:hypothetical protein
MLLGNQFLAIAGIDAAAVENRNGNTEAGLGPTCDQSVALIGIVREAGMPLTPIAQTGS